MGKRLKWLAVTLMAVTVLAVGVGATVASAATPSTTSAQGACGQGGGFRFGGVLIDEAVTKTLGMTADEIRALRQEGKSLVQVAATRNVTQQQLVDAIMAFKKAEVQERVAAGTITQEQANLMLQQMQENTVQSVNRTSTGPMNGRGYGNANRMTGDCTGQGPRGRLAR